jgi:NAD+ synthase
MLPIGDLYKSQVRQMAADMGIPDAILRKPPTADLWAGQTDEDELGLSYVDADRVLYWTIDRGLSAEATATKTGLPGDKVARVLARYNSSAFKREIPYRHERP